MKLIEEHKHIYNLQKAAGPPALCEERGFSQQFDDKPMSAQRDRSVGSSPSRMEEQEIER